MEGGEGGADGALWAQDEVVFADHTLPRCVYWDDQLFPLPAKVRGPAPSFVQQLREGTAGTSSTRPRD